MDLVTIHLGGERAEIGGGGGEIGEMCAQMSPNCVICG